jgi:ribosomal protein RSM22 (predicted rRNA methylase)
MSVWRSDEIKTLARLRDGFLSGSAGAQDYWSGDDELSLYERTFAQRIGWKWDAVLSELSLRKWKPPARRLVDWGCGTGVAARRMLEQWPHEFETLVLSDRSPHARAFACDLTRGVAPNTKTRVASPEDTDCEGAVVLLSHVLTELSEAQLVHALEQWKRAAALVWVEAATHDNARRLVEQVREPLLKKGWRVCAPCTHGGICPLMRAENERHWCHHFARVPSEVHQDPAWRELSQRLNLDLRVLPYSYVVLEQDAQMTVPNTPQENGWSRVIGTPREFKGHLKVLACDAGGVRDWVLQKRDAPELYKELRKAESLPLHRWKVEGQRIIGEAQTGV